MMLLLRIFAGLALMLMMLAGPGHAHAVLQATDPVDGSVLNTAPDQARIQFNEAVAPLSVRLVAPDGTETNLTDLVPGADELVIPLPELGQGTYVLSWRVVSDDGHPIPGSLIFSVGEMTGAISTASEGDSAALAAIWLARFVMTTGLVLGVGGALFGAITPIAPTARHKAAIAAIAGFVAAPIYLGLHGLDALGLGFSAILTPAPWAAAWGTSFGPSVAMAMAAAALAILGLRFAALSFTAVGLLAISYAISGHAGSANPQWLTRPMVFIHLAAVSFWIGALIPLALSLRNGNEGLRRFSDLIPVFVILLLGSGLVLAAVQLGHDPALWLSPYGNILAAKLGLLAVMFMLAAFNRWKLTEASLAGDAPASAAMRRSIIAELLLAVAILGLTAGWRFTPPPRALAESGPTVAAPASTHLHSDQVMAMLTITPGRSGPAMIEIQVTDGDMVAIEPIGVNMTLALPERGIEALTREAAPVEGQPGLWVITELVLPQPGTWSLELDIRLSRFELFKLGGETAIE